MSGNITSYENEKEEVGYGDEFMVRYKQDSWSAWRTVCLDKLHTNETATRLWMQCCRCFYDLYDIPDCFIRKPGHLHGYGVIL